MNTEKEDSLNAGLQVLITKLGHPLEEIRVRSLQNISSKIEYGIITEKHLIADKQLLTHLFNWFNFSSHPEKSTVLKLILKLANTLPGKEALISSDAVIFFTNLRKRIETHHQTLIDEILESLCLPTERIKANEEVVIARENEFHQNINLISTSEAAEIDGLSEKFFLSTVSNNVPFDTNYFEERTLLSLNTFSQNGLYFTTFPWISLNSSDRHVLMSTNESLQNDDAKELGNLCKFLRSILFQDFPAEIFLERPQIFFSLLKLIKLDEDKLNISTESVRCLQILTSKLKARIKFYCDPTLGHTRKSSTVVSTNSASQLSSPRSRVSATDHYPLTATTCFQGTDSENDIIDENLLQLQLSQITVPEFCIQIFKACLPLCREIRCEFLAHVIQLMHLAADAFEMTFCNSLNEENILLQELNAGISDCFNLLVRLLEHHRLKFSTLEDVRNIQLHRLVYLCIVSIAIRILRTSVEIMQVKEYTTCHPVIDALVVLLFDPSFYLCYPQLHSILLNYVNYKSNDLVHIYNQTLQVCESMKSTNLFLKEMKSKMFDNNVQIVNLAENSLPSLTYHKFPGFIQHFVDFLSISLIKCSNDDANEVAERGRILLIKLLKHSSQVIRLITFRTCHNLVKQILNTSGRKNINTHNCCRIKFLFDCRIIRTFCESGLFDENVQIIELSKDLITYLIQGRLKMGTELWSQLLDSISGNFSVLQGFADSTSALGRAVYFLTDLETSVLSKLELLRGTIRLMYTSDHQLRCNTLASLAWFLTSESNSKLKLPSSIEVILQDKPNLLIPEQKYIALKRIFYECELGNLKNILEIAKAPDLELEIKKSAIGQLPYILEDSRLHNHFIDNGVECLLKLIEDGLIKDNDMLETLPVCFHSLMTLVVQNPDFRQTMSGNYQIYLQLLRGALIYYNESKIHQHICVTLSLLLFKDDFFEIERIPPAEGGDAVVERVFSLPFSISNRYKLPLKVIERSVEGENNSGSEEAQLLCVDNAKNMLKIFWNVHWCGNISKFINKPLSDTDNEFSSILNATSADHQIVSATHTSSLIEKTLLEIKEARSHRQVRQSLAFLRLLVITCRSNDYNKQIMALPWEDSFAKFFNVFPSSTADKRLLKMIIEFFIFLLTESFIPILDDMDDWLLSNLFSSNSAVYFALSNQTVDTDSESRSLNSKLIRFVSTVIKKCQMKLTKDCKVGDIILFNLQASSVSDAAQFYNLASLEAVIRCLMHLTFRPGWSDTCTKISGVELCERVFSALKDVIIAFHAGLGQSNNSLMGRGVTLAATVSLQHLIAEMTIRFEGEKWVELWISQDQRLANNSQVLGLMWLVPLWLYRDEEVRSTSLCIAVALSENATGCLALMTNLEHISGGIWGAAFRFLLDPNEVTCVKEQAALLLVNLTRHLYTDENRTLIAQNLTVKDSSTNELLVGVDALRALLYLSNFFQNVVYFISCYVRQPFEIFSSLTRSVYGHEKQSLSSITTDCSFENVSLHSPDTDISNLDTPTENLEPPNISSLITPSLICNLCKLIQNLGLLVPKETFEIFNSQMLRMIISCLDIHRIIYSFKSSSLLYSSDLLKMHSSVLGLISLSVVKNSAIGTKLCKNSGLIRTLVELLDIQLLDMRKHTTEDVHLLWSEVYKLLWLLLTLENPHSTCVTYLSRHCIRIGGNMLVILEHCKAEKPWLNCLKFFSVYYKTGENISTYLDDVSGNLYGMNLDITTVGAFLCHLLLRKYGEIFSKPKQDFMTCGIVFNSLSALLSISKTAKSTALKYELIKHEVEHLKDIYVSITLASLENVKMSATKKIETPWQQCLILHFDLLQCFMHSCHDAKVESSQHGLSGILHQLWCWCLQTPVVLTSLLSLLCTYTANCKTSIRSVAYTSAVQGSGTLKTLGVHSLVHALLRLANNENDRVNSTKDVSLLTLVFQTLSNMCLGSECRSIVCKTNFLDGFSKLNSQQAKKYKHQILIESLWLHFLLSLTFHSDGQDAIVRMPVAIDLLIEFVGTGSSVSVTACRVLRNMCCSSSANKSLLLNSDRLFRALIAFLKNESNENKPIAASALWALTANCQKAKSMLRNVSLMAQLQQICLECDNSDKDSILTAKHLRQVLDFCQMETTKTISQV